MQKYGITHGSCIDKALIQRLCGCSLEAGKDKNQRSGCGCMESMDRGAYDTYPHGCHYCYANKSSAAVAAERKKYRVDSPILCSEILSKDMVTERKVK